MFSKIVVFAALAVLAKQTCALPYVGPWNNGRYVMEGILTENILPGPGMIGPELPMGSMGGMPPVGMMPYGTGMNIICTTMPTVRCFCTSSRPNYPHYPPMYSGTSGGYNNGYVPPLGPGYGPVTTTSSLGAN